MEENVIHYCVPNMTSVVARSATHALNNAAWPFISAVADTAPKRVRDDPALRRGVATHQGQWSTRCLASHLGVPEVSL